MTGWMTLGKYGTLCVKNTAIQHNNMLVFVVKCILHKYVSTYGNQSTRNVLIVWLFITQGKLYNYKSGNLRPHHGSSLGQSKVGSYHPRSAECVHLSLHLTSWWGHLCISHSPPSVSPSYIMMGSSLYFSLSSICLSILHHDGVLSVFLTLLGGSPQICTVR